MGRMEDIATRWMVMTIFVFAVGALVALVWSFMAGQWQNLGEAAAIPLSDEDDLDDSGRGRS